MDPRVQEQVLGRIVTDWAAQSVVTRPRGVWISRHAPVPEEIRDLLTARGPATPVEAA